jgi:hypothetical protein
MSESHDLVLLQTCGDNAEASVLRSLLEANGIRAVVQGEQHRSMLGVLGPYVELRVLISPADLPRAQALLREEGALREVLPPDGGEPAPEGAPADDAYGVQPRELDEDEPPARRDNRRRWRAAAVLLFLSSPLWLALIAGALKRCA